MYFNTTEAQPILAPPLLSTRTSSLRSPLGGSRHGNSDAVGVGVLPPSQQTLRGKLIRDSRRDRTRQFVEDYREYVTTR